MISSTRVSMQEVRDQLAFLDAAALAALPLCLEPQFGNGAVRCEHAAAWAYNVACAMLEERRLRHNAALKDGGMR